MLRVSLISKAKKDLSFKTNSLQVLKFRKTQQFIFKISLTFIELCTRRFVIFQLYFKISSNEKALNFDNDNEDENENDSDINDLDYQVSIRVVQTPETLSTTSKSVMNIFSKNQKKLQLH